MRRFRSALQAKSRVSGSGRTGSTPSRGRRVGSAVIGLALLCSAVAVTVLVPVQPAAAATNPQRSPVPQAGQASWTATAVSVGLAGNTNISYGHGCAVTTSPAGGLKCWGYNSDGQMGVGNTTTPSPYPVNVSLTAGGANAHVSTRAAVRRNLSAAATQTCVVVDSDTTTGGVLCWGKNNNGQLADGSTTARSTPVVALKSAGVPLVNVVAIAAGGDSGPNGTTCAVVSAGVANDGSVYCWGYNSNGQVGDGTTVAKSFATQVSGLTTGSGAIDVSTGEHDTCALFSQTSPQDGGVQCWGDNNTGQTGAGTATGNSGTNQTIPITVRDATGVAGTHLSGATAITTGSSTSCAIVSGALYCWGWNSFGQIGDGTQTARQFPKALSSPLTSGVTSVSEGDQYTCAVASGAVYCWGLNDQGQVGDGTTTTRLAPLAVQAPGVASGSPKLTGVSTAVVGSISSGARASCANLTSGPTVCWGQGTAGQLGDGFLINRSTPVYVDGTGPDTWATASVSASEGRNAQGSDHACSVTTTGGVKCWGQGGGGQMGNNTTNASNLAPVDVVLNAAAGASPVARVDNTAGQTLASAQSHSCVIFDATGVTGGVQCWGLNGNGELGDGSTTTPRNTPVIVRTSSGNAAPLTGIVAIAAGSENNTNNSETCAINSAGAAFCWGYGLNGRLGNSAGSNSSSPVPVTNIDGTSGKVASAISVGGAFACAVVSGAAKCWGWNGEGELGNGTTTASTIPVQVGTLTSGVNAIAAGSGSGSAGEHACASTTAGAVWCWGSNGNGELGDNTTTQRNSPVQVMGIGATGTLGNVVGLTAGSRFNCAILSSGAVNCWGINDVGQLGDGSSTQRPTPVAVLATGAGLAGTTTLSGASTEPFGSISAGSNTTCLSMASGSQTCWGYEGANGELGHGIIARDTPTSSAVSCTPSPVLTTATVTCTVTVTDTASQPAGSVTATATATGAGTATPVVAGTCTLAGATSTTATCSVTVTSATVGTYRLSSMYGTQSGHIGSSAISGTVSVASTKLAVTGPASCQYLSSLAAANAAATYQLDETSGATAADVSGNANTAAITTAGSYNNKPSPLPCDTQQTHGALGFNGTTTSVTAPAGLNAATTGTNLTVMGWFKSSSLTNGNSRLVSNSHTDADFKGFQLMFNSGGATGFFDIGNGTTERRATWTSQLVANTWYFYAGTYDGTTVTAYLNGVQVATATGAAFGAVASSGANVIMGAPTSGAGDKLAGQMAGVSVLPTALSGSAIAALYNPGTQTFPATTVLPAVRVQAQNAAGVATSTPGLSISLALTGGSFASGTTTGTTNASGYVDFTDLAITTTGSGYSITASEGSGGALSGTSPTFNTSAATQLIFSTQPVAGASGSALTTQPVVRIADAGGATVTSATQAVTLAIASGSGGTLSGCSATTTAGVASFSGCTLAGVVGSSYTLGATSSTLSGTSGTFQLAGAGTASQLAFSTQPVAGASGSALTTQPVVRVTDASGNTVTGSSQAVTLSIASGAGGTLSGCSATTTAGVASFSGCTLSGVVGTNYTLGAAATSPSISGTSGSFQVSGAGAGTRLVFTTQPGAGTSGTALGTQPVVKVTDDAGNIATSSSASIALDLQTGSGSLTGCSATTASGVATFSGCTVTQAAGGTFTLNAQSSGLTTAISSSFLITGDAARVVFTTQPVG
ncbi:MAG: regulator of chromosome condensation, partial [Acidimicrobiales bacterium]|nr:regulator of chromosome condensation [Acidimicrobiales bacterium]